MLKEGAKYKKLQEAQAKKSGPEGCLAAIEKSQKVNNIAG
jgi:hypothetical protein